METTATTVALGKKNRLLHIEFLRVLAIFCVIYNHTNEKGFFYFATEERFSLRWLYLGISICCKIAVPLFFAISGAMLLGKTETIGHILRKRVARFVIVLIAISAFYGLFFWGKNLTFYDYVKMTYGNGATVMLWYLYSYIAFLLMLPMLRKMARAMSEQEYVYLAVISLLLVGVIPLAEYLLFKGECKLNGNLRGTLFVTSNVVYPLLGYYIEHVMPAKRVNWKSITLGIVASGFAVFACAYLTFFKANYTGVLTAEQSQTFFSSLTLIPTCTMYICAKAFFTRVRIPAWLGKLLVAMGGTTFGVYLLEEVTRQRTEFVYNFLVMYLPSPLASICWVACAMSLGMVIIYILKKLPVFRKLL